MNIARNALTVAGAVALALGGMGVGFLAAQPAAAPAPDSPTPGQVHIAVIYDRNGEISDVDLTDSEGRYVPVGSIAEDREAMYPAEYANTDTEEN